MVEETGVVEGVEVAQDRWSSVIGVGAHSVGWRWWSRRSGRGREVRVARVRCFLTRRDVCVRGVLARGVSVRDVQGGARSA